MSMLPDILLHKWVYDKLQCPHMFHGHCQIYDKSGYCMQGQHQNDKRTQIEDTVMNIHQCVPLTWISLNDEPASAPSLMNTTSSSRFYSSQKHPILGGPHILNSSSGEIDPNKSGRDERERRAGLSFPSSFGFLLLTIYTLSSLSSFKISKFLS